MYISALVFLVLLCFCMTDHVYGYVFVFAAYWRFWLCVSVVYELFLIFILFQVCYQPQRHNFTYVLSILCHIKNFDFSFRQCMMAGSLWSTLTLNWASLFLKEIMVETVSFMTLVTLLTPSTISGYALKSILINTIDTNTDVCVIEGC